MVLDARQSVLEASNIFGLISEYRISHQNLFKKPLQYPQLPPPTKKLQKDIYKNQIEPTFFLHVIAQRTIHFTYI